MKRIRLTENRLRDIIREALNEFEDNFINIDPDKGYPDEECVIPGYENDPRFAYGFPSEDENELAYGIAGYGWGDPSEEDVRADNSMSWDAIDNFYNTRNTNENKLRSVIRETVKKALTEGMDEYYGHPDNDEEIAYELDQYNLNRHWTPQELDNRNKAMDMFVHNDVDPDYVGGAWDAIH